MRWIEAATSDQEVRWARPHCCEIVGRLRPRPQSRPTRRMDGDAASTRGDLGSVTAPMLRRVELGGALADRVCEGVLAVERPPRLRERVRIALRARALQPPYREGVRPLDLRDRPPACRSRGSDRGPDHEARIVPHLPAIVRDPSARGQLRHPYGPGAAWASRREHDDDLHARRESRAGRGAESDRSTGCRVRGRVVGGCGRSRIRRWCAETFSRGRGRCQRRRRAGAPRVGVVWRARFGRIEQRGLRGKKGRRPRRCSRIR